MLWSKHIQLDGVYSKPRAIPGVIDRERSVNVQSASGGKREEAVSTNPHGYAQNNIKVCSKVVLNLFFPSQTVTIVCSVDDNYVWEFIWCIVESFS